MSTALGLIEFAVYVAAVVGVAAGVTWVVVKLTPTRKASGSTQS